jgi:acyl-CoA synthetase (AMP-forming)/AMP-acid ligase II
MYQDTDCLLPRLKQRSSSTVCLKSINSDMQLADPDADQVAEAAVVGINDELTGQAVNAFVSLKDGTESSDQVKKDLILQVRKSIGPFAAPKAIFVVPDLPKTRSGKIMRRIMRKILAGEEDQLGDITTVSQLFHMFVLVSKAMTRSWWREDGLTASRSFRIRR